MLLSITYFSKIDFDMIIASLAPILTKDLHYILEEMSLIQ
jgi:hypothetical protein